MSEEQTQTKSAEQERLEEFDALVKKLRKDGKAYVNIADFPNADIAERYMTAVVASARRRAEIKVTAKRVTAVRESADKPHPASNSNYEGSE